MKADLKREITTYVAPRGRFEIVTVAPAQFLMIDGHGDPNTAPEYADALATLYPVAYGLKFLSKNEIGRDYTVMPLEALWWADDLETFTSGRDKSQWDWTVMNLIPDWLTAAHLDVVRDRVARKSSAPVLDRLRLEPFAEGLCVQTLHLGPYDAEGPVLERLHHDVVPDHGLRLRGKHHEIYLSDARRTAPEKLRTILRQPVEPA
ncbi:MAG: GyrI-like domain-containing protein [Actinobacteria bacterium]|uniref:GyrI-like domain-containing protein n=1 Tax=Nostocoides veronense TaxID=330836 RepID=A0ABP4XTW4_9MICO|nr:GyrI-like domain-containing protein [Actinomycetota bacterium]